MPKIKVELEVPNSEYCDIDDTVCPMCLEGNWDKWYCCLFESDLKIDTDNGCCIRCDECKQSEVEE